jgi:cellulose synthase/poly-beta-1,6-N-acetylglucosamine synthase-like glycosyltransferase
VKQEKEYIFNDVAAEIADSAVASYDSLMEATYKGCPSLSSKFLFSKLQKIFIFTSFICLGIQLSFNKDYILILLHIAASLSYISMIFMKVCLLKKGISLSKLKEAVNPMVDENELPSYSIILPLYKEEGVIDQLVTHMQNIDYPDHLLSIFIVLEIDDIKTQEAFKHINLPKNFIVLVAPDSYPKTKPKACNYAMQFIYSDIVVIYDAEDIPHHNQLRDVALSFKYSDSSVACIQCQLYWYNMYDNWLSFMFAIEYKILFEYLLPALDSFDMPIPLGGTSNHIRVDKLKEIGCWDEYNVTEDADLGIRLARNGLKTKVIRSRTVEEAPVGIIAWIKQRTRWIKGYLQTFIAHTRNPQALLRDLGLRQALFFMAFIGISTISYLLAGISFSILIIQVIFSDFLHSDIIRISSYFIMLLCNLFLIYQAYVAKKGFYNYGGILMKLWWTYPIYFILHIIASFRALYQLLFATHLWEKTEHSISKALLD